MEKFKLVLLLLVPILNSCIKNSKSFKPFEIIIDNQNISNFDYIDKVVDSFNIVPLQTNSSSLIPDWADDIIVEKKRIFVADFSLNKISIFDERGKFINKILPSGDGPGEYTGFQSMVFNDFNRELELFSGFQRKLLIYNENGIFLREEPQNLLFQSKKYLTQDICVYSCHVPNSEILNKEKSYKIVYQNKSTNKVQYYCSISDFELNLGPLFITSHFNKIKDSLVWFEPFNNNIKTITENGVTDRYFLKFTKNQIPVDYWDKRNKYTMMLDAAQNQNFPFLSDFFFENNRYIVFIYDYNKINHLFIYDKMLKKTIFNANQPLINKWKLPLTMPRGVNSESLLFFIPASDFKNLIKYHIDKKLLPKQFLLIDEKLKMEDNPIILKIFLK